MNSWGCGLSRAAGIRLMPLNRKAIQSQSAASPRSLDFRGTMLCKGIPRHRRCQIAAACRIPIYDVQHRGRVCGEPMHMGTRVGRSRMESYFLEVTKVCHPGNRALARLSGTQEHGTRRVMSRDARCDVQEHGMEASADCLRRRASFTTIWMGQCSWVPGSVADAPAPG